MRKSRFTEAQMVTILREADKGPVAEVAKKHGISEQTIYTWRKRYGVMDADEVKRLRQMEQENGRLKKLLALRYLEIEVMKEIAAKEMVSAPAGVDRPSTPEAGPVRTTNVCAPCTTNPDYERRTLRRWRRWRSCHRNIRSTATGASKSSWTAAGRGQVWAYDFVFDSCANG